jgi:hypothetical protein
VALVERIEVIDAQLALGLGHGRRWRRRDLKETAPAVAAVARVER